MRTHGFAKFEVIRKLGLAAGLSFVTAMALVLTGCELSLTEQAAIDDSLNPSSSVPAEVPLPAIAAGCHNDRFAQPGAVVTRKLDILFVADTSSSLDEERGGIADGIDALIGALPTNADIRIGVILAHGTTSPHYGKLFQSSASEPRILTNTGPDALPVDQLKARLREKMTLIARDASTDGGEAGMVAMSGLMGASNLSLARSQGFFRDDAALAVVMISDEQDICYSYPSDITPVIDLDNLEIPAKARDCGGITPATVVQGLRDIQGDRPLLVSAAIYTDRTTYAKVGENEMGYGWRDMARLANGITVDLADPHYQDGLAEIGTLATVKLALNTEFALSQSDVDGASIQVKVDGAPAHFNFLSESNEVQLTDNRGGALSTIDVTYCPHNPNPKISAFCQTSAAFTPKSSIKLGLSVDTNDSLASIIVAGFTAIGHTPTVYSDGDIASGRLITDGVNVLAISHKIGLAPVTSGYLNGVRSFIAAGGSLLTEYDGAALMFDEFDGDHVVLANANPALELYSGVVQGGGHLLPPESSRLFVTDAFTPLMEGMPSNFLVGIRMAFAISSYDADWLHQSASFTSTGFVTPTGTIPAGTYPAVLSGRCNAGRVAIYTMSHFNVISQNPVNKMIKNTLYWLTGRQQ